MECYSHAIEDACGCVIYYMPRLSQNISVCSRASSSCYNSIRISLDRGENVNYSCPCLPACDELSYSGTITTAPLITTKFNANSDLTNYSNETIV